MQQRAADESLVNAFAVLVLIGLTITGLHWWGYDTGIPHWLLCTAGRPVLLGYGPGLITLTASIGVLLAIVPFTRSAGISMLVMTLIAMVMLETAAGLVAGYCTAGL